MVIVLEGEAYWNKLVVKEESEEEGVEESEEDEEEESEVKYRRMGKQQKQEKVKEIKMSEAQQKLHDLQKQMKEAEEEVFLEKETEMEKVRLKEMEEFIKIKRKKTEIDDLLRILWEFQNPKEIPKSKKKTKSKSESFGLCKARTWGNGFGCKCGKKSLSLIGYCKRHQSESEKEGNCIGLGNHEEERPTKFLGGTMSKTEKIGDIIKWRDRKVEEETEESSEDEVEDLEEAKEESEAEEEEEESEVKEVKNVSSDKQCIARVFRAGLGGQCYSKKKHEDMCNKHSGQISEYGGLCYGLITEPRPVRWNYKIPKMETAGTKIHWQTSLPKEDRGLTEENVFIKEISTTRSHSSNQQ